MTPYYSSFHRGKNEVRPTKSHRRPDAQDQIAISKGPPLHVALLDSSGVILSVNAGWEKLDVANLLRGPAFAVGRNYLELCERATGALAEKARAAAAGIRRMLQGQAAEFSLEYAWPSPKEEVWFRLLATRMGAERASGLLLTHANISARVLTDDALWRSEQQFRSMFTTAAAGIAISNLQGRFLQANQAYCQMLGYTEEELLTRNFTEVTHPADLPLNLKMREELLAGQRENFLMEKRYLKKGGDIVWVRHSVCAARTKEGTITQLMTIAVDITEQKRVEQSLSLFRTLIDKSDVSIVMFDAKTPRFIDVSVHAHAILGYSREEFLALSPAEIKPDITPLMHKSIEHLLDTVGSVTFESRLRRKDGTTFPVEIHANRVRLDGSFDVVVVRDITERKKLEQQLYRSQRMESIGALAGGIAHDLNNILAPIMMSIRVLKDVSTDPHARDILKTIEASAQRGGNIVRQILSFARGLEGHRGELRPKLIARELSHIIKDTFPKDIQLRFSAPNNIWMISGDSTQVNQVLLNLCLNARDAMPKGGQLTIAFENCALDKLAAAMEPQAKSGRFVLISITDTGCGMKPDVRKRIFEPFYTTKAIGKGTGLGLSTALSIVKSHHGHVNVYSEPGKGTTFKIYFPALPSSVPARRRSAENGGRPRGQRQTILVVDDEPTIRKITQRTLTAYGYEVLTACNGAQAVALYTRHRKKIAVVLTDMAMPTMDGAAVIRALTKLDPNLKIIAASGLRAKTRLTKALQAKVKYFLVKPYTAETLLRTLRATLRGK